VSGAFVQKTRISSSIVENSLREKVPSLVCWMEVWELVAQGQSGKASHADSKSFVARMHGDQDTASRLGV
jgi:hypothetical protein